MKWQAVLLPAIAVALASGCSTATTTKDAKDTTAVTSTATAKLAALNSEQTKQLSAVMTKGLVTRSIKPPPSWIAEQVRWSPRRHFGPLYGNSPDLHLDGNAATFVYNRFFTGHPDAPVFQKYYGAALPSNQPTLPQAIPGTVPNGDGFRDVRLSFDQLTYSSRYGGSFKLTFLSIEDFQVEYRKGTDAWDIGALQMNIYVRPSPNQFNPNSPITSGTVWLELLPQQVTGYTLDPNNNAISDKPGDPMPALAVALADTAQSMRGAGTLPREAARFSYGLVHSAFWGEIGANNSVNGIELSDNFFLPRTSAGNATAVVSVQLANVRLNTEPGDEEIYPTIVATHQFRGNDNPPSFSWSLSRINDGESTGWKTVGVFPVPFDCSGLETIFLQIKFREQDDPGFDDNFITDPHTIQTGQLNCAGMQTAFNNGELGLFSNLPDQPISIVADGEVEGAVNVRMRVSVIRQ